MRYLFGYWPEIRKNIGKKFIMLCLDYDGTLTPIVDTPDKAVLQKDTKEVLYRLSKASDFKLVIISGRAVRDVKRMVNLDRITYIGNHGLEIEDERIKFKKQSFSKLRVLIEKIKKILNERLREIKGVFVEDKGLNLSLHYRLADKKDLTKIKNTFDEVTQPYLTKNRIKISFGKKVFEVRPPLDWDKGKAILWLLKRQRSSLKREFFPIYIGDDLTDEDAFFILRDKGLTVFVGRVQPSHAEYYLRDCEDVFRFLKVLNSQFRRDDKSKRAI